MKTLVYESDECNSDRLTGYNWAKSNIPDFVDTKYYDWEYQDSSFRLYIQLVESGLDSVLIENNCGVYHYVYTLSSIDDTSTSLPIPGNDVTNFEYVDTTASKLVEPSYSTPANATDYIFPIQHMIQQTQRNPQLLQQNTGCTRLVTDYNYYKSPPKDIKYVCAKHLLTNG
jgi:hypothetical protein